MNQSINTVALQSAALGCLLIFGLAMLWPKARQTVGEITRVLYAFAMSVTGGMAYVLDRVLPISMRRGKAKPLPAVLWFGFNAMIAVLAATIDAQSSGPGVATVYLLLVLLTFNVLFLCGTRFALHEEAAIGHRVIRYHERKFGRLYGDRNFSTPRDPLIVSLTAVAFVAQLASALHLGDAYLDAGMVEVRAKTGVALFDMIIAVLGATPAFFAVPYSGENFIVNPGLRIAIGFFATSVLWFAGVGFVKRRTAARRLVVGYIGRPDERGVASLEDQVHMGPSLIRHYIADEYRRAKDDEVRRKLLHLATKVKRSYGAPVMFLRSIRPAKDEFRKWGTEQVVQFLVDNASTCDPPALKATLEAVIAARESGALHSPTDFENGGLILICAMKLALEKGVALDGVVKQRAAQECFFAALNPDDPPLLADEARDFWRPHIDMCLDAMVAALPATKGPAKLDEVGRLLRMLRHGTVPAAEKALVAATMTVRDSRGPVDEQLQMVIRTATWLRKQNCPPQLDASLRTLIKTASARLKPSRQQDAAE
jgi:hypothetical protein